MNLSHDEVGAFFCW